MCSTATNVCCVTKGDDGSTDFTSTCEPAASCMTATGVALGCGSTADCPTGSVCCLYGMSSYCGDFRTATSNCYGGGVQLCGSSAPHDGPCNGGNTGNYACMPGGTDGRLPTSYWTCQPSGDQ
jgi:hypothetical protein